MTEEFAWLSLDPDEEIVWSGSPRLIVIAPVPLGALIVPAVLLVVWQTWWSALAGATAWLAMTAVALVYVRNVEFVVSSKYVYSKRGVFGRVVTQIGLQNVQDSTLRQGVLGTQFGHGTISFSTAGGEGDELRMYSINDPTAVKARVDEQVGRVQAGGGRSTAGERIETDRDTADVEALLAEARSVRAVAERIDDALASDGRGTGADALPDGGSVDTGGVGQPSGDARPNGDRPKDARLNGDRPKDARSIGDRPNGDRPRPDGRDAPGGDRR